MTTPPAELVSIIIPTYGRPEHLTCAIDSVLTQTYKEIEIVVVDDNPPGSTGRTNTEKLLGKYSNNERIKLIKHNNNKGGALARNTGVHASSGDLITFLDDDDTYHPEKIEKQVMHMKAGDLSVSLCASTIVVHDKISGTYDCQPRGTCLKEFLLFGAAVTPMIMLRRTLFMEVDGFEDTPRFQDHVFMIKIHERNATCGILPLKLYTQNIHSGARVSYSPKSRLGYEIKHKFEARNFSVLSEKEIDRVIFRQSIALLGFTTQEKGLMAGLNGIFKLLPKVREVRQAWAWLKTLVKIFMK